MDLGPLFEALYQAPTQARAFEHPQCPTFDMAVHYNRFDVFSLTVDRRSREVLTFLTEGNEGEGES